MAHSIKVKIPPLTAGIPIKLSAADLPLSCPLPGVSVWNLHPKVYLPIEKTGEEMCPYCSAHYILEDKK